MDWKRIKELAESNARVQKLYNECIAKVAAVKLSAMKEETAIRNELIYAVESYCEMVTMAPARRISWTIETLEAKEADLDDRF